MYLFTFFSELELPDEWSKQTGIPVQAKQNSTMKRQKTREADRDRKARRENALESIDFQQFYGTNMTKRDYESRRREEALSSKEEATKRMVSAGALE